MLLVYKYVIYVGTCDSVMHTQVTVHVPYCHER